MGVNSMRRITVRLLCIIAIIGLLIGLVPNVYAAEPTWPRIKENSFKFKRSIGEDVWADEWIVELPVVDTDGNVNQQSVTFTSDNIQIINNTELITTYGGQITNNKVGKIVLDYGDMLILQPDNRPTLTKNYEVECYVEANYEPVNYIDLTDGFYPNVRFFTELNNRQNRFNYDIVVKGNHFIGTYPDTWEFNEQNKTFTINSSEISNLRSYNIEDKLIPTWGTTLDNKIIDLSSGLTEISLTNAAGDKEIYYIKTQTTVQESWQFTILNKSGYNLAAIRIDGTIIEEDVVLEELSKPKEYEIKAGQAVGLTLQSTDNEEDKVIDTVRITREDGALVENSVSGNTVSFTMPEGNLTVTSVTFKNKIPTENVAWPTLKEEGIFADSSGLTVTMRVADAQGNYSDQPVTFTSNDIEIVNYDTAEYEEEFFCYKVGKIILNYGDKLVSDPGKSIELPLEAFSEDAIVYSGDSENVYLDTNTGAPFIYLTNGFGENELQIGELDSGEYYAYDVYVTGDNFICSYPNDWGYAEGTKTFTITKSSFDANYNNLPITNLIPAWGTVMDKTSIDFSSSNPASVEFTKSTGEKQTYSISLVMPQRFSIPGRTGFNMASLIVGGKIIAGETLLERLTGSKTYDINSGDAVVLTIVPYGDDEGKIINTISLITEDGMPVDAIIDDNVVSFVMPERSISVSSVSFKEADTPWFVINGVSTDYSDDKTMGSVLIKVNDNDRVIAYAGDSVSVKASANEHAIYEFVFSHWETEDIELMNEQKTNESICFIMPERKVNLTAVFEKRGVPITFVANPGNAVESIGTFSTIQGLQLSSIMSQNGVPSSDIYKPGSTVSFIPAIISDAYLFDGYSVTDQDGNAIPYEIGNWQNVIFTIPETGVTSINVVAKFKAKEFSSITAKANDASMGTVTATVNGSAIGAAVLQDETVNITAMPAVRYKFVSWDFAYADGSAIDFEISDSTSNPATFVVPDNGKGIVVTGNFELDPEQMSTECYLLSAALYDGNTKYTAAKEGAAFTITVPADLDVNAISNMVLKLTSSEYATIKKSGDTEDWPAEGKACGMTINTPVTFTVTAEDGKTTQDYIVTLAGTKSSEKEIKAVRLLDGAKNVIAQGVLSGDTWTIELPSDIDPDLAGRIGSSTDVFMQIEYTGASLMQVGGYDDAGQASWNTGTILCGVSANSQKDFTVTAEDGSTKDYIIAISYTASDAPTISNGSVERTGENTAIVKFTSNQVGSYYYQLVEKGGSADVDTNKNGSTALAGENTLNISNLTADARDVYIIVKNAAGVESIPYKLEIPAYETQDPESGSYTISIMTPKGGNLSTNVTTANQGDSILVTVSPNSGYQMVEGSMTYTMAVAGGETVKIMGNRFTMPDCDVTLTCRWEEAVVEEAGITSFVIMGVSGVISQSSDTEYNITLALPHGTDVTNLTPAISSNGNVTISPTSGKAQDFSSPVTYTVKLEDGSKLTYKVSVYVSAGSKAERMWENITDITTKTPWWEYANELQKKGNYPKYW